MSLEPLSNRVLQYGLTEVYSAADPQVDIVFVHGLNGHPYNTWATHKPEVYWPADLLPLALQEQSCRILTYGYDANVTAFTDGVSKDRIHNHGEHLASRLVANRALKKALERPIIFVCHSLGGLVVKRCLIYSESLRHSHTERLRSIYVSTYGILFLGTPHNGSGMAKWATVLERISSVVLPKRFFDSSPQLVEALKSNNETLQNINRLFVEMIGRFHIYFFHESRPMDMKTARYYVVDEDSAAPHLNGVERMGIERDHSHMCKFESEAAPGFDVVAEAIQRYAEDAPVLIQTRWEEEKRARDLARQGAARELLGGSGIIPSPGLVSYSSPQASQPISAVSSTTSMKLLEQKAIASEPSEIQRGPRLVAPLGFRPNSIFVGFQFELDELRTKLNSKKRRELGSCSVLIWGPPGCGKTYLARQFFYQYRNEYPMGSFWVDCKSRESILNSLWDIGTSIGSSENDQMSASLTKTSDDFVDAVRRQLEAQQGWLLVFDGVALENEGEIDAFKRYLPDKSGNSIIFTSVDRSLAKRQRLLNPSAVKVHPLTQEEACALLFRDLGIRKPSSTQKAKAIELVKDYQCLPLAVHAAAHALIEKGRALERYSHRISDFRLSSPFLEIMTALHEKFHVEALNLITLLSFFNHYVPVAVLHFGRRALSDFQLDILSPKRVDGARKDLDSTIAILLRSGLLERTLQAYPLTTPGSVSPQESRSMRRITNGPARSVPAPKPSDNVPSFNDDEDSSGVENMAISLARDQSSTSSGTSTIDLLQIHSVVQNVIREDLKERGVGDNREYWWWLTAAVHLLSQSFARAHEVIKRRPGQGLVRDYREYDTQAVRLWSFFPKSADNAPNELRRSRHELHEVLRAIKHEISNLSPSQSSDGSARLFQGSVFEYYSSSSDGESFSPSSALSRVSTNSWTVDASRPTSESPTAMQSGQSDQIAPPWDEIDSVAVDSDSDSDTDSWPQHSDTTETPNRNLADQSRRNSVLRAIFEGKPRQNKKQKDLGEWKPMPALPSISQLDVQVTRPRASSQGSLDGRLARPVSAGSEAEAALAAVHRSSPPASRGGRIRSPNRVNNPGDTRQPLSSRSANAQLSPLATEFQPSQYSGASKLPNTTKPHSRQQSSSPRLVQALLTNRTTSVSRPDMTPYAVEFIPSLSGISGAASLSRLNGSSASMGNSMSIEIPTGYTSVPMSRDTTKEPGNPTTSDMRLYVGSAPLRTFSDTQLLDQAQDHHRRLLENERGQHNLNYGSYQDRSQTQNVEFGRIGDWAATTPLTPVFPSFELAVDENRPHSLPGALQFGSMDPVEIAAARTRASIARERSAERPEREPRSRR